MNLGRCWVELPALAAIQLQPASQSEPRAPLPFSTDPTRTPQPRNGLAWCASPGGAIPEQEGLNSREVEHPWLCLVWVWWWPEGIRTWPSFFILFFCALAHSRSAPLWFFFYFLFLTPFYFNFEFTSRPSRRILRVITYWLQTSLISFIFCYVRSRSITATSDIFSPIFRSI